MLVGVKQDDHVDVVDWRPLRTAGERARRNDLHHLGLAVEPITEHIAPPARFGDLRRIGISGFLEFVERGVEVHAQPFVGTRRYGIYTRGGLLEAPAPAAAV
jgi:hypothetical protein